MRGLARARPGRLDHQDARPDPREIAAGEDLAFQPSASILRKSICWSPQCSRQICASVRTGTASSSMRPAGLAEPTGDLRVQGGQVGGIAVVERALGRCGADGDVEVDVARPGCGEGREQHRRRLDVDAAPAAQMGLERDRMAHRVRRADIDIDAAAAIAKDPVEEQVLEVLRIRKPRRDRHRLLEAPLGFHRRRTLQEVAHRRYKPIRGRIRAAPIAPATASGAPRPPIVAPVPKAAASSA